MGQDGERLGSRPRKRQKRVHRTAKRSVPKTKKKARRERYRR